MSFTHAIILPIMDITLIKTFLEVVNTGNFVTASERLFVSQSAVSLRVKSLEESLGLPVFIRNKSGVTLTPAGTQFLRYAQTLLQLWEEAKQQVAVPEGYNDILVVAGEYGLWSRLLIRWLPLMEEKMPEVAFRAEVARPDRLSRQMVEGSVDIAVLYTPQIRPSLHVEELFEDEIVLVTTNPKNSGLDKHYIYVDWGEEFGAFHATHFPDYKHPRTTFDIGPITINYLLNKGGSAYLPERLVKPLLENKKLYLVKESPQFKFPVHVVWRDQVKEELVTTAIESLKTIVKKSLSGHLPPPYWQ